MDVANLCGNYSLTHVDGRCTPAAGTMTLTRDGDNLHVLIKVGNTLRGRAHYEDGHISAELISTMVEFEDERDFVENALSAGFLAGLEIRQDCNRYLLKNASCSFVFDKTMSVSDLDGAHAIISLNDQPVVEEFTMEFSPDGNGGSFVVARIANTLRGDCRIDYGVLQGEIASTHLDVDPALAAIEQSITEGLRDGFKISDNETGIFLESPHCRMQLYHIVTGAELAGEYFLKCFNGSPVRVTQQSTFSLSVDGSAEEQVNVFIVVGNRLRGAATLEQNVLKSEEPLLATRMMGTEEEAQIEAAYNAGLQYGLEVVSRKNGLVLRNDDCEFELARVAPVHANHGEPAYKGNYVVKCFKTQGNGLLFRIVNEHDRRWAFYNDTKDYRMHVQATFGKRSAVSAIGNATEEVDDEGNKVVTVTIEPMETEMFITGDVNGFKVAYNAEPL